MTGVNFYLSDLIFPSCAVLCNIQYCIYYFTASMVGKISNSSCSFAST